MVLSQNPENRLRTTQNLLITHLYPIIFRFPDVRYNQVSGVRRGWKKNLGIEGFRDSIADLGLWIVESFVLRVMCCGVWMRVSRPIMNAFLACDAKCVTRDTQPRTFNQVSPVPFHIFLPIHPHRIFLGCLFPYRGFL